MCHYSEAQNISIRFVFINTFLKLQSSLKSYEIFQNFEIQLSEMVKNFGENEVGFTLYTFGWEYFEGIVSCGEFQQ